MEITTQAGPLAFMTTRHSAAQRLLLRLYPGQDLRQILVGAYYANGTVAAAAASLGINEQAFRSWLSDLDLKVEVQRKGRLVSIEPAELTPA